jgi:hypothetical protein
LHAGNPAMEDRTMSGLKTVAYTTLIVGASATGLYVADKTFNLGIKENIAARLIDNPADASKIYLNELKNSKDNDQKQISGVILQTGQYLKDNTKILTADELMRMSSKNVQESYLESKLKELSKEKKTEFVEETLMTMSMDEISSLISAQPDSVKTEIAKDIVGDKMKDFYDGVKEGVGKAYNATLGKLFNKE